MPIKIAAAYIRVSTDDQIEYSPESQLKAIRDHAKREGYLIPEEYIFRDEGISGRTADKRPAFRLMIAQAKEGKAPPFEAIFVWKWSRFARNQEESIMYRKLLRKRGVDVASISEPSTDSPFSSLIESIIAWMDEYYLINLAGEVKRGMKEKAARGEAMGTAPYGYSVQNKTFVPNGDADTVRYIFRRFADGVGARALAQELGEKGVRTRRGNVPDNRWITYIVGNPTYIGKVRWSTEGRANYSRANYNGENVLLVDGKHPPIIEPELWDRAQQRLRDRDTEPKYVRRKNPKLYMLKGLIRCSACGSTLTYQSTASPTLQCHRYARGQCRTSHSITLAKAEAAVIGYLEEVAETGAFTFSPQPAARSAISQDWTALIAAEERRLRRARSALLDGVFTQEEYRDAKADIEATLARLQATQAADEDTTPPAPDPAAYTRKVRDVLTVLKNPRIDPGTKNQALRSIIDKIIFHRSTCTFDIYFLP